MSKYDVIDCRLNPNGLYLKLQNDSAGKQFELYGVKLYLSRIEEDFRLFPLDKKQKELKIEGSFSSQHPCNQIKDCEPLEVTIEDIEKKFGRKIKIVKNT